MPLYRALRDIEIDAGYVLIPKSKAPFVAHPRIPNILPFRLGEHEEHAVRDHQWNGNYETRGISCTTSWEVALKYAKKLKVIVRISEEACDRLNISRICVSDMVPSDLIVCRDDQEIIIVSKTDDPLPKEIIAEVFHIETGK